MRKLPASGRTETCIRRYAGRSARGRSALEVLVSRFLSLLAVAFVLSIGALLLFASTRYTYEQPLPIKLGTSGGDLRDRTSTYCCSGTLGALVSRNGTRYILSANHVLARSSQAAIGED